MAPYSWCHLYFNPERRSLFTKRLKLMPNAHLDELSKVNSSKGEMSTQKLDFQSLALAAGIVETRNRVKYDLEEANSVC